MSAVGLTHFAEQVRARVRAGAAVPLLIVRVDTPAEREGATVAAFERAARRVVRACDPIVHAPGDPHYAVAMLAPARAGAAPSPRDVRTALERLAAAMGRDLDVAIDRGWALLTRTAEVTALPLVFAEGLARGRRERDRRDVLATVGHELRTPLTAIRGYVETLLEEELDRATRRQFLQTVKREALRLGRLVDGMLEFSMLDLSAALGGTCEAGEVTAAVADALLPLARRRGVRIACRADGPVPLRIDADACTQAVLNVVENAVKHGRHGGCVAVAARIEGAYGRIDVDDDGPGVAGEEPHSLFAFGARGRSARTRPGFGIGLAIVEAIVMRAGGQARAARSPLGGARFSLFFPISTSS